MTDQTSHIAALTRSARPDVVTAIRQASARTGVDFAYLLEKAATESSFDPKAQAGTSSARGLYQFIDRTWLDTMDRHGAAHGYPNIAGAITRDTHGNPVVKNESAAEYILSLRENPRISALMAAELAQDNKQTLEGSLGREVGNAELYMAHFLGAGSAAKFIGEMETNGDIAASSVVPAAARANTSVFYEQGRALTLEQVFARFEGKFSEAPMQDSEPILPAVEAVPGRLQPRESEPARAAIIAASDPALAALRLMADAFNPPEDDKPNEWLA
jgi:hypothetical protein